MGAEIVIRGGTVVDGTGRRAGAADVAVADGRIVGVGAGLSGDTRARRLGPGRRARASSTSTPTTTPRCSGTRALTPSAFHGVTTVIAGNCGFSIAPVRRRRGRAAGPHAPARRGHELRHARRRRAVGRVRDLPPVPRRRRAARRRPQLRLLRRPHRGAPLRHGPTTPTSARPPTTSWRRCSARWPRRWPAAPSGSPPAPPRPTTATAADRCRPGVADLDELRGAARARCATPAGASWRCCPAGCSPTTRCSTSSGEIGRPFTWTALLTIKGIPYHEGVIAEHDAARADGRRGVAAGVVPAARVPDEPRWSRSRFNMRPSFPELMDAAARGAASPRTATRRGGPRPGRSCPAAGLLPVNWDALVGRRVAGAPRPGRAQGRRPRGGAGRDPARRAARPVARGRPADPVLVRARQQRPRGHRLAAAPRRRAARPRRLRRPREPAVRRLLLHRPARRLGARQGGHAARAGDPQAHRRAGRASTASPTAASSPRARPPTSWCSTPTPSRPGPLRRVRDFPADGERLTADAPVGVTHMLVNGVPIRVDGEQLRRGPAADGPAWCSGAE